MNVWNECGSIDDVERHVHLIVLPIDIGADIDLMVQFGDIDIKRVNPFKLSFFKPLVKPFEKAESFHFGKSTTAAHEERDEQQKRTLSLLCERFDHS